VEGSTAGHRAKGRKIGTIDPGLLNRAVDRSWDASRNLVTHAAADHVGLGSGSNTASGRINRFGNDSAGIWRSSQKSADRRAGRPVGW
jgi:hypothetical protein